MATSPRPQGGAVLGEVRELWRYPVKSMQGEHLDALDLDEVGVAGDRRWAVRDESTGRLLHGRTTRPLLNATARIEGGVPIVSLPDGEELSGTGPASDSALSSWLGRPVRLVASQGADAEAVPSIEIPTDGTFAAWTEVSRQSMRLRGALARMRAQATGAPPETAGNGAASPSHMLVLPSLPGTLNDCEAVHLLSDTELAAGRNALPDGSGIGDASVPTSSCTTRPGRATSSHGWVGASRSARSCWP